MLGLWPDDQWFLQPLPTDLPKSESPKPRKKSMISAASLVRLRCWFQFFLNIELHRCPKFPLVGWFIRTLLVQLLVFPMFNARTGMIPKLNCTAGGPRGYHHGASPFGTDAGPPQEARETGGQGARIHSYQGFPTKGGIQKSMFFVWKSQCKIDELGAHPLFLKTPPLKDADETWRILGAKSWSKLFDMSEAFWVGNLSFDQWWKWGGRQTSKCRHLQMMAPEDINCSSRKKEQHFGEIVGCCWRNRASLCLRI